MGSKIIFARGAFLFVSLFVYPFKLKPQNQKQKQSQEMAGDKFGTLELTRSVASRSGFWLPVSTLKRGTIRDESNEELFVFVCYWR